MIYPMEQTEDQNVPKRSASEYLSASIGSLRKCLLIAGLALLFVLGADQKGAAEGPAVSTINAKAQALFGSFDSEGAALGLGSLSLPIGREFGFQVEGGFGEVSADDYWGGGAHFFWRDPSIGLLHSRVVGCLARLHREEWRQSRNIFS